MADDKTTEGENKKVVTLRMDGDLFDVYTDIGEAGDRGPRTVMREILEVVARHVAPLAAEARKAKRGRKT